jgi:chemotaxis protein methyltransferase CheR
MTTAAPATIESLEIDLLLEALARHHGFDFRGYARSSLRRRVRALLASEQLPTVSALQGRMLYDPAALHRLLMGLTVNVSAIFRDPGFFLAFRRRAVPMLRTYPFIRVWLAGCSTGEEVYSLAILLQEEGLYDRSLIYATDMNETVLAKARRGIYPVETMQKAAACYTAAGGTNAMSSYYTAAYDHVILNPSLRERVVFSQHNLVSDGPFNEFNVILCRNVMIYFSRPLQDHVHDLFLRSLTTFGILGLGSHETLQLTPAEQHYEPLEPGQKLYKRVH